MAFFGGIAHQDLRWGFTCEFCGKEAEIKTTLTEKVGENHKASSTMIGGPGARTAFEASARNVLRQRMEKTDSEWRNGQFEAPKEADGKCPHCHKYQSWSKHVLDAQKGGIQVDYEGKSIFKIVFTATLAEGFDADGAKGDDFCKAMYSHINGGCKLTFDGGEGEQVWGYWPEKASQYSATQMTLFYTVPEGTEASALTFTLDGGVLGDAEYQFSYKP